MNPLLPSSNPFGGSSSPVGGFNFTFSPFSFTSSSVKGLKERLPAMASAVVISGDATNAKCLRIAIIPLCKISVE